MLEDGVNPDLPAGERGVPASRISIHEAFYLATAGGGESLSLPIGRIQENYAWDVQVVDTKVCRGQACPLLILQHIRKPVQIVRLPNMVMASFLLQIPFFAKLHKNMQEMTVGYS